MAQHITPNNTMPASSAKITGCSRSWRNAGTSLQPTNAISASTSPASMMILPTRWKLRWRWG